MTMMGDSRAGVPIRLYILIDNLKGSRTLIKGKDTPSKSCKNLKQSKRVKLQHRK